MKKTLLIILMILAISVIFILPQLPVQKLFDDSSESLIEADNSNEISQSRIAEKTKYRKDAQLVLEKIVDIRDLLKSKSPTPFGKPPIGTPPSDRLCMAVVCEAFGRRRSGT